MCSALLIVLGLVIGIVGTVFAMNALHDREPYSHTLMTTMAHHAGALSAAVKAQKCDGARTQHHLARLLETQADIDESFPGVDQPFKDEAAKLREKTQAALQAAPADCTALAAAIKPIGETCQSCHQQYR